MRFKNTIQLTIMATSLIEKLTKCSQYLLIKLKMRPPNGFTIKPLDTPLFDRSTGPARILNLSTRLFILTLKQINTLLIKAFISKIYDHLINIR